VGSIHVRFTVTLDLRRIQIDRASDDPKVAIIFPYLLQAYGNIVTIMVN
jgi:hypothetical protein